MKAAYFNKLNYTLANEDTSMEYGILPGASAACDVGSRKRRQNSSVTGEVPKKGDLCRRFTRAALSLEMRFESLRTFSHPEFLAFWGYPPSFIKPQERRNLFDRLKLSPPARDFFQQLFEGKKWESILYEGKWERMIAENERHQIVIDWTEKGSVSSRR